MAPKFLEPPLLREVRKEEEEEGPIITSSGPFVKRSASDGKVAAEGIKVFDGSVYVDNQRGNVNCSQAKWTIGNFSRKLQHCSGRSLTSPPFTMVSAGLEDAYLMVSPDAEGKRQKEYKKLVSEGPLNCSVKVKMPRFNGSGVREFYLSVGSHRVGPFKHDFKDSAVSTWTDFGINWLDKVDLQDNSLTMGIEILHADAVALPHGPSSAALENGHGAMSVQAHMVATRQ
jgi:hypothetical protein